MGSGFVTLYMYVGCAIAIVVIVALGAVLWYFGRGSEKQGGARIAPPDDDPPPLE
jgi:hypothetical protein